LYHCPWIIFGDDSGDQTSNHSDEPENPACIIFNTIFFIFSIEVLLQSL